MMDRLSSMEDTRYPKELLYCRHVGKEALKGLYSGLYYRPVIWTMKCITSKINVSWYLLI